MSSQACACRDGHRCGFSDRLYSCAFGRSNTVRLKTQGEDKFDRGCASRRGHASRFDCGRLLPESLGEAARQVTTDNGGAIEDCKPNGASNYPLRGGKCSVWEGGTRGTALVYGPGLPAGLHWQGLFHGADWLPTLLCAAGATSLQARPCYATLCLAPGAKAFGWHQHVALPAEQLVIPT